MPRPIRVVPEDLHASAAKVDNHAEELEARHAAADGRIEAAQAGVPAASVAALTAATTKWQADSAVLFTNLTDHSEGLRGAAVSYVSTEQQNTSEVTSVGHEAISPHLNL